MILVQILVKDLFNMIKKIFFSSFLLIIMFCGCMTQNEITGSVAKLETVEKVVDDTLSHKNRHKTQRKAKFYLNNWRSVFYMQGGLKQTLA